jgi:Cu(I)/Ag(I) efflux system protein CusF
MKKTVSVLAVALSLAAAPCVIWAQSFIDGTITKVDTSAGKITIKHGPIKKFDMEDGMTMVFRAQDPAMLQAVKPGDKIKFDAENVNGQFVVTKIEKGEMTRYQSAADRCRKDLICIKGARPDEDNSFMERRHFGRDVTNGCQLRSSQPHPTDGQGAL